MLYYDKINISKGIDPTKSNRSKECMVFHYWLPWFDNFVS